MLLAGARYHLGPSPDSGRGRPLAAPTLPRLPGEVTPVAKPPGSEGDPYDKGGEAARVGGGPYDNFQ